jgi:hypothetical protein
MLEIIDEIRPRKQERMTLRERVGFWFGMACLVVLVGIATNAYAQDIPLHVLDKDGISISLMDRPCTDPVSIGRINPQHLPRFKAVRSVWPEKDGTRKEYAGCWATLTPEESGSVEGFLIVFSDGESGFIPKSEFKKTRGQVGV